MYTRKNQRDLTRTEKRRLVDAILKLKRSGRYDDFVVMHREYYVMDTERRPRPAHMTSSFFPWHRQYLLEFEKALQRVDAGVSVPYWDWTQDDKPTSSLWAEDFLGGNGRQGDRRVTTGAFAYEAGNWSVGRGVTDEHYLTRNFGRPGRDPVSLPTGNDVARALKDPVYDTEPWNSVCTEGFRNRIEGWGIRGVRTVGLHNRVHQWVGGPMAAWPPPGPGVLAPPLLHRPAVGPVAQGPPEVRLPAGPQARLARPGPRLRLRTRRGHAPLGRDPEEAPRPRQDLPLRLSPDEGTARPSSRRGPAVPGLREISGRSRSPRCRGGPRRR